MRADYDQNWSEQPDNIFVYNMQTHFKEINQPNKLNSHFGDLYPMSSCYYSGIKCTNVHTFLFSEIKELKQCYTFFSMFFF